MNYKETIDYLFRQLPMYQRIGPKALKLDLDNITRLCDRLGNPHEAFDSVHIAGTNGKGTVAHLLSAALQDKDLKVGLYTSPHYKDFRERIKINGDMISKKAVINFVSNVQAEIERKEVSFFEISVAMAFEYFKQEGVDIAIIETGLGGRLDSTNIIQPLLSVITNISFEHQATLGDTLQAIAREKAGIIKNHVPVVIGQKIQETRDVFYSIAEERVARIYFAEDLYCIEELESHIAQSTYRISSNLLKETQQIKLPISGIFQCQNMTTALASLQVLSLEWPSFRFEIDKVLRSWRDIRDRTGYLGRWQILSRKPMIIADSAHNAAAWENVLLKLSKYDPSKLHFVLGFSKDKDLSSILNSLPKHAKYYFCKARVPRGMDAGKLSELATSFGIRGKDFASPGRALASAKRKWIPGELIFIGGSVFTVAEFL